MTSYMDKYLIIPGIKDCQEIIKEWLLKNDTSLIIMLTTSAPEPLQKLEEKKVQPLVL